MNGKVKFALTAVLLAVFAVGFAGEALARPDWISCSYTPSLVVTGKDASKSDYYSVKIVVEYKNNSKQGKVITKIFDKTLTFSAGVSNPKFKMNKTSVKGTIKSSKVNDCGEIYPGQTYSLAYFIPVSSFKLTSYYNNYTLKDINEEIRNRGVKSFFPNRQYTHDFQVHAK
jgi:hypothetical protein